MTQKLDVTHRMNWFDRQFLRAQDFVDEQDYQLDRRHRHNRLLHTEGVAEGLYVTGNVDEAKVVVGPGSAIDGAGRELVVLDSMTEALPSSLASATSAEVYVVYEEQGVEPSKDPGSTDQWTRVKEATRVRFRQLAPTEDTVPLSPNNDANGQTVPGVLLAELSLNGGKLTALPETNVRHLAGTVFTEAAVGQLALKVPNQPQSTWPRLAATTANTIDVDGDLQLRPGSDLLMGPTGSAGRLSFDPTTKVLDISAAGGVALGAPNLGLGVVGSSTTISSPDVTGGPGRLHVFGGELLYLLNRSGVIVGREWGGTGNLQVQGCLQLSVGDDADHGIMFPLNPGGGAGDEAFIRYLVRSGEATSLVIGCNNDADDRISFVQSGKESFSVRSGVPQVGTLVDGVTTTVNSVVGAFGFLGNGVQHAEIAFRAGRGFELVDVSATGPVPDFAVDQFPYCNLFVGDLFVKFHGTINTAERLHISGGEQLYLLNKDGVIVSKAWGGNGNLQVEGNTNVSGDTNVGGSLQVQGHGTIAGLLGTGGFGPVAGIPNGWGGGVHTWDVYAEGTVGVGSGGTLKATMSNDGHISCQVLNVAPGGKNFVMDHPLDPDRRLLIHSAVECPEYGVFYRGEARLTKGRATVALPKYFESLVRTDGRTVLLTPIFEDDEPVAALAASRVVDGKFQVRTVDGSAAAHSFAWQVHAVLAIDPMEVEPRKADRSLEAFAKPAPAAASKRAAPRAKAASTRTKTASSRAKRTV